MNKRFLLWLLPALIVGLLVTWGRFTLVEPAAMIAACQQPGAQGCALRQAIIELFVHQRIGWFAVVTAVLATLLRWQWLAAVAVAASVAALMLYTAEPGALGLVLGVLVLARGQAKQDSAAVNARAVNIKA